MACRSASDTWERSGVPPLSFRSAAPSQEFLIREFAPPGVEAGIGLLSRRQLSEKIRR